MERTSGDVQAGGAGAEGGRDATAGDGLPQGWITIRVSPGDLIDRMTILQIKVAKLVDPVKRRGVESQLDHLRGALAPSVSEREDVARVTRDIERLNRELWDLEDALRQCESRQDFGARFIEIARRIALANDRRYAAKREIDEFLGVSLLEEKVYAPHDRIGDA